MVTNFEKEFIFLGGFLGCDGHYLFEKLGVPDDNLENESGGAFAWYTKYRAYFFISKYGIVKRVAAPKSNAKGEFFLESSNFFSIDDITLGMVKIQVKKKLGTPDKKYDWRWVYYKKGGISNFGQKYCLCICFGEIDNTLQNEKPQLRVTGFEFEIISEKKGILSKIINIFKN